jgi:hypothetical protein
MITQHRQQTALPSPAQTTAASSLDTFHHLP